MLEDTSEHIAIGSMASIGAITNSDLIEAWPEFSSPRISAPKASSWERVTRLARYAATSGIALGISEATLLLMYATGHVNATFAALVANLAGILPSYLLSRYWIWRDRPRASVARQIVLYWTTSLVCIALSSWATGRIASLAPAGHPDHLAVVGVGFPALSLVFWLTKYVLYQKIIFRIAVTAPS